MSPAGSKPARKKKSVTPDEKRCVAIRKNGNRCKAARLKGGDKCPAHTKGCMNAARSAAAALVNTKRAERRAQIQAAKAYLPLQTREQLADFNNLMMVEADEGSRPFPEDMKGHLEFQLKCIADASTGAEPETLVIQVPADA